MKTAPLTSLGIGDAQGRKGVLEWDSSTMAIPGSVMTHGPAWRDSYTLSPQAGYVTLWASSDQAGAKAA